MYWYDGKIINSQTVKLSISDPGLLYGATVFTTMRVHYKSLEHSSTAWQAHRNRLKDSIDEFGWKQPDWSILRQGLEAICAFFPVLRIAIFADGRELITGRNLPADLSQRQTEGITAWVAKGNIFKRDLAQHKTGNYLGAYLAREQALKLAAQEAILCDRQGNYLETSTGNLWGRQDNYWYTPKLSSGILPGIGRSRLLNYFLSQSIPVQENTWTEEFIRSLDCIFYSNCVVGIVPIKKILASGDCFSYEVVNLPQILAWL